MRVVACLAALTALAAPGAARAATLYVDERVASSCTTYDVAARACGGGAERAFHRIQDSFAVAAAGDVVLVRGGRYAEEQAYGPIPASGTAGAPIVFRGYAGEDVVVEGSVDPHVSSGVGSPFRLFDVDYVTIEDMEITGFFQAVVVGGGDAVRSGPADHVTLRNLRVHDNGLGIYVRMGSSNLLVEDVEAVANYLIGDGGAGLMVRDGVDVRVERMISRDNDDGRGIDGDADGFHVEPGLRITFVDCVARNNSEDGYDLTGDEIRIERSVADLSGAVGFKLWDEHASEHAEVYRYLLIDSIAMHSGEAGIFAANGPNVEIYSSVVYGNTGEGVRFTRGLAAYPEPTAPVAIMVDDIVAENGRHGRRFGDGGGTDDEGWDFTSDHNIFFSNVIDDAYPGEGTGTLTSDPQFVDAAMDDFHLAVGSPAIDAGRDLSAIFTLDFDGVSRPVGAAWDIGAFEHGVADPDAGASRDSGTLGPDAAPTEDGGSRADGGARRLETAGCGCTAAGAGRAQTLPTFASVALFVLAWRVSRTRRDRLAARLR